MKDTIKKKGIVNKVLAIVIIFAMVFCDVTEIIPIKESKAETSSFWDTLMDDNGDYHIYVRNTATIDSSVLTNGKLVVPDSVNGHTIIGLGDPTISGRDSFFLQGVQFTSECWTFAIDATECTHLKTVNPYALYHNSHVDKIYLPTQIETIKGNAFKDSYEYINVYNNNPNTVVETPVSEDIVYHGPTISAAKDVVPEAEYVSDGPNTIHVTLNANGGSLTGSGILIDDAYIYTGSASEIATYASACTLKEIPTRQYYQFEGYYAGTQKIYNANGTLNTSAAINLSNDTELTAKWSAKKITFRFNSNGGRGSMSDKVVKYDDIS